MRISSALLLIVFATSTTVAYTGDQSARTRCWSSGNGESARWWNEGERVNRGKYWYECRSGQLLPRGCFSDKGEEIGIGQTAELGEYLIKCQLSSDGYLEFVFSACISEDGQHRQAGETWSDPKNLYYYKCAQDGKFLRMKIEGCMSHDKSKKLLLGEKYDFGEYTYECHQKANGVVQMCSVGCIHGGDHYKVGQQWQENEFVYYCKLNGGRCQKKVIGCVYEGKSLYDGDRYRNQDTVYQCEIRPDSYGHKPVGCVSRDLGGAAVERVIRCRWYLSSSESKIEQTCEMDGEKTRVNTVGCIFRYRGFDTIFLEPGCYTIFNQPKEKKAVGLSCKSSTHGAVLETFEMDQLPYHTNGMKYTQPRGK